MSNVSPQKPNLNRRLWAKIERFVRFEAKKYGYVRVITGSCGSLGTLGKRKHNVNIPKWWYKIIFLPNKKIISFLVLNSNNIKNKKIKNYLVPIEKIEKTCKFEIK